MLHANKLLRQFGIFWLVFLAFQLLFSMDGIRNGLAGMHASLFTGVAKRTVAKVEWWKTTVGPENGEIIFNFYSKAQAAQLAAAKRQSGGSGSVQATNYELGVDPKYHVYTALAFLIALFLATPLQWKRRLALAAIAAVLFYLFTFLRMTVKLKYEISQQHIGLYENDPNAFMSLSKVNNLLGALGLIFIVVIFIWAFLVFTKKNIGQMKVELS